MRSAVALVNSAAPRDSLNSIAALDAFLEEFAYTGSRRRTLVELREVRSTRSLLRHLLTTTGARGIRAINAVLREARPVPQFVRHDGLGWHIHALADDAPLATRICVETAMAMAEIHRSDECGRIKVCEAEGCGRLIFDLSRNRSRRFCSTTCGNRLAVIAYRERQRALRRD
jgi:predicted RNA-binding Zn ribbon-like protein